MSTSLEGTGVKPTKKDRKKFELDLQYGSIRESDYWFHNLCIGDEEYCTLVFKTEVLKKIVDKLDTFKTVSGGDHNASRMFLVNLPKLFSTDVIKAFKELDDDTKK